MLFEYSVKPLIIVTVSTIYNLNNMKKLLMLSAIVMSGLVYQTANAQIGVRFNVNLGGSPVYVAPAPVYNDADYYYLPEVEAYYSVHQHCYYYQDGGNWITAAYLPGRFHDYDWQHAHRYAVNGSRPYLRNDVYRARFGGVEHRDWGYRDNREYADRDRISHEQYRGHEEGRWNQQRGYRENDGRRGEQQYSQQNNDRGRGWNNGRRGREGERD